MAPFLELQEISYGTFFAPYCSLVTGLHVVAINRENAPLTATIGTGLLAGTYCDILTGGSNGTSCSGTSVTVSATGTVQLTLAPNSAIAVHTGARL